MRTDSTAPQMLDDMSRALTGLRSEMLGTETLAFDGMAGLPEPSQASARNLLHYLALRRHDLRGLQGKLESLGLSTLEGAESRALQNVDAILGILQRLDAAAPWHGSASNAGRALLDAHTDTLFGPARTGRAVRIMVTMPVEAAREYTLVRNLVSAGMDCMRINCAHDDADVWDRMLHHLRRAAAESGRSCRAVMDLAGPKLRTCAVEPAHLAHLPGTATRRATAGGCDTPGRRILDRPLDHRRPRDVD
jgi:pyruvate kinase